MRLFWSFLLLPIIEIALFIQIGGALGLWPTLALVVLSSVAGVMVIRAQGALAVSHMQRSLNELRDPTQPMAHGALIMLAGALLFIPGFFTSTIGLLLMLRPVRDLIMRWISSRVHVRQASVRTYYREPYRPFDGQVIDGDYVDEDEPRDPSGNHDGPPRPDEALPPPAPGRSGWTRHEG